MRELPERFAAHGRRLAELQARIAGLHQRLAIGPDGALEVELSLLMRERDERLRDWALIALAWQTQGGQISLTTDPGENATIVADLPVPAPVQVPSPPPALVPAPSTPVRIEFSDPPEEPEDPIDLSVLEDFVISPSWTHQTHSASGFDPQATHEMAARLGPPLARETDEERLGEAAALDRELQRLALWTEYPRGIQRALVGLYACRLRYLQEESPSHIRSILERQIRKDFARLTQFSSDHQPGWVTGLSRQHKPETGSWLGDSEFWWKTLKRELGGFMPDTERAGNNPEVALNALQLVMNERHPDPQIVRSVATRALNAGVIPEDPRLVRLLIGHLDALSGDKALKRLRRAVRRVETGEEDDEEPLSQQDVIPPDWPYLDRTRGHAAVMVGGEVREQRRAFIQDALGFTSLEWISGYDVRQMQNLAERIAGGRLGFVILLARFISHKVTDILLPACRSAEVDWVVVKQGYGLSQIQLAIERYLDDPQKAAAEDEEEED